MIYSLSYFILENLKKILKGDIGKITVSPPSVPPHPPPEAVKLYKQQAETMRWIGSKKYSKFQEIHLTSPMNYRVKLSFRIFPSFSNIHVYTKHSNSWDISNIRTKNENVYETYTACWASDDICSFNNFFILAHFQNSFKFGKIRTY